MTPPTESSILNSSLFVTPNRCHLDIYNQVAYIQVIAIDWGGPYRAPPVITLFLPDFPHRMQWRCLLARLVAY